MNFYIARQPIFDRNVIVYGYELLFRNNMKETRYSATDPDMASSRTIVESFHSAGIENITGGKRAFINFTSNLLLENIASLFPKNELVVEILEDVEPTPEVIEVCRWLKDNGYTIALDDFTYRPNLEPLVDLADIIKFDFLLSPANEIRSAIKHPGIAKKILLAEKIEDVETFSFAINMGFELFQGYFFSKPTTIESKELAPLKMNYLRLIREANRSEFDFKEMADIIRNDVALSFKLLKLVNSAYFSLLSKVTDIRNALMFLGIKEARKWVSLLSMMGIGEGKPDELIKMSMIRARFMEQMGNMRGGINNKDALFLTGLFSLIDVLIDQDMGKALSSVAVPDAVSDALLKSKGETIDLLNLVKSLERCDWDETDRLSVDIPNGIAQVSKIYLESVKWCNELPI